MSELGHNQPEISPFQDCGNMTTAYSRFARDAVKGVPAFLRFFIDILCGQPQGTYSDAVIRGLFA